MQSDFILYIALNYFRVARFARIKYKLSVNCLLVLSGVYVYSKVINQSFTRRQVTYFTRYFDSYRINKYFTVLNNLGYIVESGKKREFQLYSISLIGVKIIEEMKESYDININEFIRKYNISL